MGNIIVVIAIGIVALILFAGLFVMAMGGETARVWSNRLMRYRILAQLVAILLIMTVLLLRGH